MAPKKSASTKVVHKTRKNKLHGVQTKIQKSADLPEKPILDSPEVKPNTEEAIPLRSEFVTTEEAVVPSRFLWGIVLALGVSFDFLFWKQLPGLNYLVFIVLCSTGGLAFILLNGTRPAINGLLLLIPTVFFGVFSFWHREPLTVFLSYALSLFSMGVFAVTSLGGKWYLYRISTYLYKFFRLIRDMIGRPVGLFRQINKQQVTNGMQINRFPVFGVIRGLLISLPIVLCLGSLLASGDLVFDQKLNEFFEDFTLDKISEYIRRLFIIAAVAYLSAGVFLHSIVTSRDEKISIDTTSSVKQFLGFTETLVVLVSVSFLFTLFVGVQFKYFFGGETNIGVAGYTYSQYARRGFNELITVAFISLVIVIGLRGIVRLESELQRKVYAILNIVLIGLVLVILLSAYQRISLGIAWHGYSRLRLYPRIFLIWLGALFVVVAILLALRRERFFAFALVLSTFGFAATISLFNIDAATVKHNIFRAWHGRNLNVAHLASLSSDAVPALVEEYLSPSLPKETRDGVGAILACYAFFEDSPHNFPYDWRSFNYSYYRAHIALEKVRPHLKGYYIKFERRPVQVKTPMDTLYNCVYNPYIEREEAE